MTGAVAGGALVDYVRLDIAFAIPGVLVTAAFAVLLFGLRTADQPSGGRFNWVGLMLGGSALAAIMGGFSLMRLHRIDAALPWAVLVVGVVLLIPFARWELRYPDPFIDVRLFKNPALVVVFFVAALHGVSGFGAQVPLSIFVRTDPSVYGYGLGVSGLAVSALVGSYVISMAVGAFAYSRFRALGDPRTVLGLGSLLAAVGFLLLIPFHTTYLFVATCVAIAGLGSGMLVAALPTVAVMFAPESRNGLVTGLTGSMKTTGGAIASAVFGIALARGVGDNSAGAAGSMQGYYTVWAISGLTSLLGAGAVFLFHRRQVRRHAQSH